MHSKQIKNFLRKEFSLCFENIKKDFTQNEEMKL